MNHSQPLTKIWCTFTIQNRSNCQRHLPQQLQPDPPNNRALSFLRLPLLSRRRRPRLLPCRSGLNHLNRQPGDVNRREKSGNQGVVPVITRSQGFQDFNRLGIISRIWLRGRTLVPSPWTAGGEAKSFKVSVPMVLEYSNPKKTWKSNSAGVYHLLSFWGLPYPEISGRPRCGCCCGSSFSFGPVAAGLQSKKWLQRWNGLYVRWGARLR